MKIFNCVLFIVNNKGLSNICLAISKSVKNEKKDDTTKKPN